MKILYTNDWHLRDDKPRNRLDDYYNTQFNKVKQVGKIFEENDCSLLIHGGDLFNYHSPSYRLFYDLQHFWNNPNTYCLIGNHDTYGYNTNSEILTNTALGSLSLKSACELQHLGIEGINTRKDEDSKTYFSFSKRPKIIVSHDMILPSQNLPFSGIYYEELDGCAELVLCAHYHKPFVKNSNNTTFINAGALMRMAVSDNFRPGVHIIDLDTCTHVRIELKAEPANKVFNFEDEDEKIIQIPSINLDLTKEENIVEKIRYFGKKLNTDVNVIEESTKRLQAILAC